MGYRISLRAFVLATSLSVMLCASSDAVFSIASMPLKEAIEKISNQSGLPYLVDAKLLDKEVKSPAILNVKGVQQALDAVLEESGLKATIKNGTIMIEKRNENEPTELEGISILGSNPTTEGTDSYTTKSTNTATKLDLSLRDTPQTVVVYTRQKLDDQRITTTQELASKIPGISLRRWDERLDVTARGFDVNYYLYDGIPTTVFDSKDPDLIIYDRVEIVKGANGLMTGAGNPAMGMNFIRKHANAKEFIGSVDASVGSWENYNASLDIQSPLNADGTIRARFIAKHQDTNSFLDFYEKTNDLFYGVVDMDLTDTTYLSLGVSYENIERDGIRWGGLPAFYTDGSKTNFSRSKNVSADWAYWNDKTITYFADFKQYLYKDVSLNVAYSKRQTNLDMVGAYFWGSVDKTTGIGEGGTSIGVWKTKDEENSLDVYVSIPFELGKLDHEIITGISYNKYESKEYGFAIDDILSSIANPTINFNHISLVNPNLQLTTALNNGKTTQKAYYFASRISLMEDLKLIAGLRVSSYESDVNNFDRKFENELVPYAGLVYDIDKHHSVYASYTSIFQPQYAWDANGNFLDPIDGKSYEAGIKGEYFDGNLNTVFSIFRIEQDGVGESTGQIGSNGYYISVPKKGVVSKGFEVGASGRITDNLSLDFGLANFEAKDANGDKFTTTNSRTTANVWAKYMVDRYRVGAGLNYKSKFYSGSGATQITQDAFVTTDLMAGYKASKNLDFQLNLNNIFDETYYEGLSDANNLLYGAPRSVTLSMKYSF